MKRLLLALAAALASIPRMVRTWCEKTRDFILECLPAAPAAGGPTTAAGEEAEEAVEMAEAREERKAMQPKSDAETQVQTVLRYAAAVVTGSRVPDVADDDMRRWLADLTAEGARRIFKATPGQIAAHLRPRCPQDHLEGVPSVGARPMAAAAVRDGSKIYLAALAAIPKVEMTADGDFQIFHGHADEDQSTRLRAA